MKKDFEFIDEKNFIRSELKRVGLTYEEKDESFLLGEKKDIEITIYKHAVGWFLTENGEELGFANKELFSSYIEHEIAKKKISL